MTDIWEGLPALGLITTYFVCICPIMLLSPLKLFQLIWCIPIFMAMIPLSTGLHFKNMLKGQNQSIRILGKQQISKQSMLILGDLGACPP